MILGAFGPENGRPGGDLGSQAGRQVGLKLSFLIKNDEKNRQKVDRGGLPQKAWKNDGKMMPEVSVLGR